MTVCAGRCGRLATGPFDSGRPGLDERFSWCDQCKARLRARQLPAGLISLAPYSPPPLPCAAVN